MFLSLIFTMIHISDLRSYSVSERNRFHLKQDWKP